MNEPSNNLAAAEKPQHPADAAGVQASPLPPAAAVFSVAETAIAKKTGASREVLRRVRSTFERGVCWQVVGKKVRWTEHHAAMAMALILGVAQDVVHTPPPDEKNAGAAPAQASQAVPGPNVEEMKVIRWRIPNRHLIECEQATGERVFVRVTSNENFRERMSVRAQRNEDGWTLIGRCPRFPGRW